MILSQNFSVVPQGLVESGTASYQVDTSGGLANYTANVVVGMLFFTKTFNFSGPFKIDPKWFLSANVKVGDKLMLGAFAMEIVSLTPDHQATAKIQVFSADVSETGEALIDCSGEYIKLLSTKLIGQAHGQSIAIQLSPNM